MTQEEYEACEQFENACKELLEEQGNPTDEEVIARAEESYRNRRD